MGLYDPTAEPGPRLLPGATLEGSRYRVHINTQGTRGAELLDPKPPDLVRIWITGGSTTFDIYAPDDAAAWPARVQALLSKRQEGPPVEIVNAGIPGATLQTNRAHLQEAFPALRPDVLVVHTGPNDLREVATAGLELKTSPLVQHLALLRVLSRSMRPTTELPRWRERRFPGVEGIRTELEAFIDEAEDLGMQVVLATHAHRAADGLQGEEARQAVAEGMALHQLGAEQVIAAYAAYNTMVRQVARERGLPLAEVRRAVPPVEENFGDATHFRTPGASLAAREVAATLLPLLQPERVPDVGAEDSG